MPTILAETASLVDWTVDQNTLVRLSIPVLDVNNAPFTVTGWTVDAKIKSGQGGDVLHTWSSGDVSATGTNVLLTVLPATSAAWTFTRGFYRVVIQNPGDATQRFRILQGTLTVSDD